MADSSHTERLYQEAMAALRRGDSAAARDMLTAVVEADQLHEEAWLWLSTVVETEDEQRICLQNVLTINPDSEAARTRLAELDDPPPAVEPIEEPKRYPDTPAPIASGDPDDDSWRASLLEVSGDRTHRLEVDEARHIPTRADLVWAWIAAAFVRRSSDYITELETADVSHIGLNMIAIAALRIVSVIIFSLVLLVSNQGGYEQAIEPVAAYLEEVGQMDTTFFIPAPFQPAVQSANAAWGVFSARPFDRLFNRIGALGQQFRDLSNRVQQLLLLLWVVYAIGISIFTVVEQFFRATIIHQVTAWLMRGKGDIFQTTHALTTALTGAMWIFLVLAIVIPLVPLRAAAIILVVWMAYRMLMQAVALDIVHEISVFVAVADLLLSGFLIFVALSLIISLTL